MKKKISMKKEDKEPIMEYLDKSIRIIQEKIIENQDLLNEMLKARKKFLERIKK